MDASHASGKDQVWAASSADRPTPFFGTGFVPVLDQGVLYIRHPFHTKNTEALSGWSVYEECGSGAKKLANLKCSEQLRKLLDARGMIDSDGSSISQHGDADVSVHYNPYIQVYVNGQLVVGKQMKDLGSTGRGVGYYLVLPPYDVADGVDYTLDFVMTPWGLPLSASTKGLPVWFSKQQTPAQAAYRAATLYSLVTRNGSTIEAPSIEGGKQGMLPPVSNQWVYTSIQEQGTILTSRDRVDVRVTPMFSIIAHVPGSSREIEVVVPAQ